MTLQRKTIRVMVGTGLLVLTAGCSGVHASKGVSPLDFLVPGGGGMLRNLLYHQPPAVPLDPAVLPGTPATTATVAPVS